MKTLRLLVTLKCNLSCSYCCNEMSTVKERFQEKTLEQCLAAINNGKYHAVCLTGGEPLLHPDINSLIVKFDKAGEKHGLDLYLYTNGLLLDTIWGEIPMLNGINVGIHYKHQMRAIFDVYPDILSEPSTFCIEDIYREEYLPNIPDKFIKLWKRNDCFNNVDKEDWVILKD